MLIDLVDPIGSNFIKDFPALNGVNLDRIDTYAKNSGIASSLRTYTPIFNSVSGTPSIGTGGSATLRGYYYEIFDQVITWGEMRFGSSGVNAGSGIWTMSLPSSVNNLIGVFNGTGAAPVVGTASIWNGGTVNSRQSATSELRDYDQLQFGIRMNGGGTGREIMHNNPFAWAAGDGLTWFARYMRQN